MGKPKFIYTPEDINQRFEDLWKSLRRNRSSDVSSVDLGADMAPDTVRKNTIQFNENGDVWYVDRAGNSIEIGGGSGSGDTLYTGDGTLAGNRTVELNGKSLKFLDNETDWLVIDQTVDGETSFLNAVNGAGNIGGVGSATNAGETAAFLKAGFNNNEKLASIIATANTTGSTITHTADTHTFNAATSFEVNAGVESNLLVTLGQSSLEAFNATGAGNKGYFRADGTATDGTATVTAYFNETELASIIANANTSGSSITHTADTHTFNGDLVTGGNSTFGSGILRKLANLNVYADNAAALADGLVDGQFYKLANGTVMIVAD